MCTLLRVNVCRVRSKTGHTRAASATRAVPPWDASPSPPQAADVVFATTPLQPPPRSHVSPPPSTPARVLIATRHRRNADASRNRGLAPRLTSIKFTVDSDVHGTFILVAKTL
eukprot:6107489-Pleurochrysis_carterae.AAC.3